jgi:aspartate 1-decarboxylase
MSEYGDIVYIIMYENLIKQGMDEHEARIKVVEAQNEDILNDPGNYW